MAIKFCPVASGSNGNCIFFSSGKTNILIDAGLSGVKIETRLNSIKESCIDVQAIFVTHEHSDHAAGVGVLSRRFDIPVFASPGTWTGMERDKLFGKIAPKNRRYVYTEENLIINDICVHPFSIPHDAEEPLGFTMRSGGMKISVATDIGRITDDIRDNIADSDIILIESNHDEEMVVNGSYSWPLKKRILGDRGHLSNKNCGLLLTQAISDRSKHVFLGHLSEENNRPALAYETVKSILDANHFKVNEKFRLHITDRTRAGAALII